MADRMSAATGIAIRHVDGSEAEARRRFLADGFPPGLADSAIRHFTAVRDGKMLVTSGTTDLLGRPSRNFYDWAGANRAAFARFASM